MRALPKNKQKRQMQMLMLMQMLLMELWRACQSQILTVVLMVGRLSSQMPSESARPEKQKRAVHIKIRAFTVVQQDIRGEARRVEERRREENGKENGKERTLFPHRGTTNHHQVAEGMATAGVER